MNQRDRTLLCIAAPRECRSVLDALGGKRLQLPAAWECLSLEGGFDIVLTGVGKSNASGATGRVLDPSVHRAVFSAGIAGMLPGSGLELLDVVVADRSVFADEGIGTESGFVPMDEAGFGAFPDGRMHTDHDPGDVLRMISADARRGGVATVSWCSGSDGCAEGVVSRTGAICEAMEGAAVALAARRIDPTVRTGELRVVSNTTGDRARQRWVLDAALERLGAVFGPALDANG